MSVPKAYQIVVAASYPPIGRFIALALRLEGYETHLFGDGEEALALLLRQPFDMALLDAELPRIDGFAVCQRVRAVSSAPIVLLLTQGGRSQHRATQLLGVNALLSLPCGVEELLACVHGLLPAAHANNELRAL